MIKRKILITISVFFSLLLLCLVPNKHLNEIKTEIEYIDDINKKSDIYLLDKNNYLALTSLQIEENNTKDKAYKLLNSLIEDSSLIPNGFRGLISSNTEIKDIKIKDDTITVTFNKYLFDNTKYKEKIIESIIYTLTSLDNINKVEIIVDNNIIGIYDRSYGINKEYKINNYKDVSKLTIYYMNEYNDSYYYVPVTKYINNNEDKIEYIVKELKDNDKLISHVNSNIKILDKKINDKKLELTFNEYYSNSLDRDEITLSIKENIDIDEIICKKSIE